MTDTETIRHLIEHNFVQGPCGWGEFQVELASQRWVTLIRGSFRPSWDWHQNDPAKMRLVAWVLSPFRRDQCQPDLWDEIKTRNAAMISNLPEPFCYPKCVSDVMRHCT
jgi:hypothetical protein